MKNLSHCDAACCQINPTLGNFVIIRGEAMGFIVGGMKVGRRVSLTPVWRSMGFTPRKLVKYDVQFCIFFMNLTVIRSLVLADD